MSTPDAREQPSQTELEQQEGRGQAERRAARLGLQADAKGPGAAGPPPFGASEPIDTDIAAAGLRSKRGSDDGGTTLPNFDRAMALDFYEAVRPAAFILGYTDGRSVSTAEQF